jgi:hypothetical protein
MKAPNKVHDLINRLAERGSTCQEPEKDGQNWAFNFNRGEGKAYRMTVKDKSGRGDFSKITTECHTNQL